MTKHCSQCANRSPMMTELMHIFMDGDPLRMLVLLSDLMLLGSQEQLLSADDYKQINLLTYLLAEVVRQQTIV